MLQMLPLETIDEIVAYLYDDLKSLTACSLASSRLTVTARRYIFQEVVLDSSTICTFMQLLDVPWCTIPPALSRMTIREKRRISGTHAQSAYTPKDRSRLISYLQSVQYVKFYGVSLDNIPVPFWSLLHDMGGVRELEIHRMTFGTPVHFFQYICALPSLEALSISRSSIQVTAVDLAPLRPKLPFYIPFLDVSKLSPGLFDWFLKQNPVPPVHTFRINLGMESADTLRGFVRAMGPSIQNLQITLPSDLQGYNQVSPPIDFSSFTNIRSVYVEGYLRLGEQPESHHFEELIRTIFTRLKSPMLKKVSLNFSLSIDETMLFFGFPTDVLLDIFQWGALPETLGEEYSINLQGLYLALRGLPPYQRCKVEQSLRKGPFASFDGRGLLSIRFL